MSRDTVFISKATPGDDDFVLWLAPRLEAAGYKVFADILALNAGDRWRKEITDALQDRSIKMLLCCSDSTLAKAGVQEEIAIAEDVRRQISDPTFIIPLRLENFRKLFGIGGLQYINFEQSWAAGLDQLLNELEKQNIPKLGANKIINSNWETYRRQLAVVVRNEPERLTLNWLRITDLPDKIRFLEPSGSVDHGSLARAASSASFPMLKHGRGLLTFVEAEYLNIAMEGVGRFTERASVGTLEFTIAGLAGSTGRRNGLGEGSAWCLKAKRLPGPCVEFEGDRIEIGLAVG